MNYIVNIKGARRPCAFYASKPVSRVLSLKTAIYLGASLPVRSSHLLRTAGQAMCSPTVLLRIEFTAMSCSQSSGGRLSPPFHPYLIWHKLHIRALRRKQRSALVSLRLLTLQKQTLWRGPLLGNKAVYLCCTFPGVTPGGCYPLSLPCGARTFLTHRPFAL